MRRELFVEAVSHNATFSPAKVRDTEVGSYLGAAGGRVGFTDAVMVPSDVFASLVDELRPTKRVPQQGTS